LLDVNYRPTNNWLVLYRSISNHWYITLAMPHDTHHIILTEPEFPLYFGTEIQGLFKDFQGP